MNIYDNVYGEHQVDEPAITELIRSPSVQRLGGISQYGIPQDYYPVPGFSRLDHSLGVMLLLRRLGASVEEQVAGLLHDVSHTAFSHVTDHVFRDDGENDQDLRHKAYLYCTELPEILVRHGLEPERIATTEEHGLLEREAPEVCADRVDYSLREFVLTSRNGLIKKTVSSLTVVEGRMVFSSREAAESFAIKYMECHRDKWASVEKTVRQHLFAQAIKRALEAGELTIADLFEDDDHAMRKLAAARNPGSVSILRMLSGRLELEDHEDGEIRLPRRLRHVDPEFMDKGVPVRLSVKSERFSMLLQQHQAELRRGIRVRVRSV
jgi:HD superfamily phosphohydrolase